MGTSAERRKHRRFEIPCRLRVELPSGGNVRVRAVNISDGGAYFITGQGVQVGREVEVGVAVPRDTANTFFLEQFAARARVIRCDPLGEDQGGTGVALEFEKALALDLA
jgi:hypothetical protein